MGTIMAILNGLAKGAKATRDMMRKTRELARRGINASQYLSDPRMLIQMMIKQIMGYVIGFLMGVGVYALILILTVSVVVGGVTSIFDAFTDWAGGITSSFKTDVVSWASNLSNEEIEAILEDGSPIHPENIPKYIEVEDKSYPKNILLKKKIKNTTTIRQDNGKYKTTTGNNTEDYNLSLVEASYPHRLWWQMVAGLDIIADTAHRTFFIWKSTVDKIAEELLPEFEWGYYEYEKTVTDTYQERERLTRNGVEVYDRLEYEEEVATTYPLAFLNMAETIFKNFKYYYNKDVETKNTGWINRRVLHTESWSVDGVEYVLTYYSREKQVIVEDVLQGVEEEVNANRLIAFLKDEDIDPEDLYILYESVIRMPESEDLVFQLTTALETPDGGLGGISGHPGVRFNPDIPLIEGEWTRADLIEVAMSLLDLPYFWGGKYYGLGKHPDWGKPRVMRDSRSRWYGHTIPYGLDCSGYVKWVYDQMLLPQGKSFVDGASNQWLNTYPISENELKPGDLGFYQRGDSPGGSKHVGIYIGMINGERAFIHAGAWPAPGFPAGRVLITLNNTDKYYKGNAPSRFRYFTRPGIKFADD